MISTDIAHAAALLRQGECVAIPTETVYGLAADAFQERAVAKVFSIKGRPTFDPLIVHLPELDWISRVASEFPAAAQALAEKFWPGPLTLILPKQSQVPDLVTSGLPSVAVRIPAHPMARELLRQVDHPLAAPSANRFGRISPTTPEAVEKELGNAIPLILDGGHCTIGVESTIIRFDPEGPALLRAGGLPLETIEAIIGPIRLLNRPQEVPHAPGQLLHHYAPSKKLFLLDGRDRSPSDPGVGNGRLGEASLPLESQNAVISPANAGLLTFGTLLSSENFSMTLNLSPTENLEEAAAHFFGMLRELDESSAEILYAVRLPNHGLGRAMNERLERASTRSAS